MVILGVKREAELVGWCASVAAQRTLMKEAVAILGLPSGPAKVAIK